VFNWERGSTVAVDLASFLKAGDSYLILSVFDFYGQPASAGHYGGEPSELAVSVVEQTGEGQCCAFIVLRESTR